MSSLRFVNVALLVSTAAAIVIASGTPVTALEGQEIDPLLARAIALYTGTSGTVDDPRAHDLLIEAAADGDALSRMWMARVYSRGRMEFERDEGRARQIAGEVIGEVTRLAQDRKSVV